MKNRNISLDTLPEGAIGRIISVDNSGALKRRLTDLGFIEGTRVRCLYRAPSGDPTAYMLRGTVIALRSRDSAGISVTIQDRG